MGITSYPQLDRNDIKSAMREVMSELNDGERQESRVSTTELVKPFLESKRGAVSEGSLTSYKYTLSAFASHCPILPTEPQDLEKYFARYKERRSAAGAERHYGRLAV